MRLSHDCPDCGHHATGKSDSGRTVYDPPPPTCACTCHEPWRIMWRRPAIAEVAA